MQIDSATFGAVIKRNGLKIGVKKERERERKWNHQVSVVTKETMNPFIVTTIQSWHGSWRHLLRFRAWRYDKVGAENFTAVSINESIIKSFSGFRDWIY